MGKMEDRATSPKEREKGIVRVLSPSVNIKTTMPHSSPSTSFNNTGLLHLDPDEADSFYREECRNAGVNPNNTFAKQLLAGVTVFDFDNGYLGGRGIVPILSTLQRLPVVELSMRNCEITTEDVSLIQQTFSSHDTLRKIDLRGVTLTVASARKLLTLALQNPRVTQILVDESTPKMFYIQKQCFANANSTILALRCLVCSKPVVYSQDQKVESRLLLSFDDELNTMQPNMTAVALQVMFRCILACCEVGDGVLFLCSSKCQMQLTSDIVAAMRAAVCEWSSSDVAAYPRTPLLRRCVVDALRILRAKKTREVNNVGVQGERWETINKDNDDDYDCSDTEKDCDVLMEKCTICGLDAVCLPNAALRATQQIFEEVRGGYSLRPSALLRLVKVMISYTDMRSCSKECITHLVRYGLYGYGGVLRSRATSIYPRVSSLDISLKYLPNEEFAIVNFSAAQIDDLEEEDTSCALTVASAMSDMNGVTIDPYMIFAVGRHLAKLPSQALGMELRSACEAVEVVGCLPARNGPFDRRKEKPPRHLYVSWEEWGGHTDLNTIVRSAFSRRQQGVYVIDGPHSNLFDNARAALWAFRRQRRAVLISMQFSLEWLTLPNGVVPNESSLKQGFLTTLKLVGQTNIENTIYLVCQANFGSRVGNHGFFYIPRGLFNLHTLGDAFIFIDTMAYAAGRGVKGDLYAARLLSKEAVEIVEQASLLRGLFYCLDEALNWRTRQRLDCTRIVCKAICHLPPSIFNLFRSCDCTVSESQVEILKRVWEYVFSDESRSILLFYIHEVLGPLAVKWMCGLLRRLSQCSSFPALLQRAAESPAADEIEQKQRQLRWMLLVTPKKPPTRVPGRPERRMAKKTTSRRSAKNVEEKITNKETRDTHLTRLEQRWVAEREKREMLKELRHTIPEENSLSARQSLILNSTVSLSAPSFIHGNDSFPVELVGQPWHSVRLCDVDGKLGEHVMFFIRNYACCFSFTNQTIIQPLHSIVENRFWRNFPFSTGFDCVLNSPVNPRIAYFFSGEQWIQWDTYEQVCTGGPFKLQLHRQFEALPSEFLSGIDAAVPVPQTSYALFFSQLKYVVFDFVKQRPVGNVRRIGNSETCEEDIPTFNSHLAKLFPTGPMATLLQCTDEKQEQKKNTKKNSHLLNRLENEVTLSVMLIGRDGRVAVVHSLTSTMSSTVPYELQTLPVSSLSRLPLVLRQMTTAALESICKNALEAECGRCGVVVYNTPHGKHQVNAITSTFTKQREELGVLLSLSRRDAVQAHMPLLRDEVVLVQTEESMLGEPPQVVEVDYGITRPVAFGVLVIVLDTSCIDSRVFGVAPIETVVESSADGVTYIRHTHFIATPCVTAVCWGEAHAARFWRLRFLTRLPVGTGIVRTLWYEVSHTLRTVPLKSVIPFGPHDSTTVNIMAPRVFCSPQELINCHVPEYVFTSSSSTGWLRKHCILPSICEGAFCLFFCGNNFVELDCENNSVVTHRAILLTSHPAFANLPHPFSMGFNAVFYPNMRIPNIVALVHNNDIILWDMFHGCRENNVNGKSPELFFKGLPWKLDDIETIVQIWDKPNEVFVIRGIQVLRWNINTAEIVEGPIWLRDCPYFYHPEFDSKELLCVTSFPNAPKRFYVFCEDSVAAQTVTDGIVSDKVGPMPVCHFAPFSPITWYLKWGVRQYDTVINIDFKEEQPLLTGVQMRSSEPCDEDWIVEYSDDGIQWSTAGHHQQSSGLSCSMWGLASVEHCSHRLWRLTTNTRKRHGVADGSVLYMSVLFFTLPSAPHRQLAQRIALSGTLNGPISALFVEETATVVFEDSADTTHVDNPSPHHITVDYGEMDPPDLMAFACQCTGIRSNSIWSVCCSKDGEQWEKCGMWRSRFRFLKVSWKPRGPCRFWRIELQSWDPNALFENLCLFQYTGPSIFLKNSTSLGDGWDPSILWEKNSEECKVSPMIFSAHVGTAVVFDAKKTSAHLVGVRVVRHELQNSTTEFVVECSSNGRKWQSLNVNFLLRGRSAEASWEGGDYYRFWRLCIVRHTGPPFLALRDIFFETFRPSLYKLVIAKNRAMDASGCELNLGDQLQEVVAVQAVLPPSSMCVVEKLSIDGSTWEQVAIMENNDIIHPRTVRQGWVPKGLSSNWRLRPAPITTDKEDICSVATPSLMLSKDACVQWFSFTGKMLTESKISDLSNVSMTTSGFIEEQAAKRLMDNVTNTVVLRSIEGETTAIITWMFDRDTMPQFHQVSFKGQIVANPDPQPSPIILPPQETASTTGSYVGKMRRRKSYSNITFSVSNSTVVEKSQVEEKKKTCLTIAVETSDNGTDYVPLAERPFSEFGNALSWPKDAAAPFWRIRFKGISKSDNLVLFQVTWFVEKGVTAVPATQDLGMLNHSVHNTWQQAAFNYEKAFCQMCREGYDQSISVTTGLRGSKDIEPHGCIAQRVVSLRGEFMGFVTKISKEATKEKNPPEDKFISIGRPLSNDVMYLLYKAAIQYHCNVDELNELISHPMLFSRNPKRSNDTLSWFYPKFEQSETLVESFYGFHNVRASFVVLWSLSLQVQRNTCLLFHNSMNPLSPHLATVLVIVNVFQTNWVAAEHFPGLPLLYHAGFSGRPVVIAFTLNQVSFNSQYNLTIPGTDPFPANYPFKLYPGANFIQRTHLTTCASPVFDCLELLYSKEFLAKYETEIVFTTPTMYSGTAVVRFTLPGEGIKFGISELSIGSIEFEVQLMMENNDDDKSDITATNLYYTEGQYQVVMFVTHDTVFKGFSGDEVPIPISLAGCINSVEEKIIICGLSPSAHFPVTCCFPDGFLTNLTVSFEAIPGETPQSFVDPTFTIKGTLTTPSNCSYACHFMHARLNRSYESVILQVVGLQLGELTQLGDYILGLSAKKSVEWLCTVPIFVSLDLKRVYSEAKFIGRGTIEFAGVQGDAEAVISSRGVSITGTFMYVRVGGMLLHGRTADGSVFVNVSTPAESSSIVRLDGYSCLLASKPYPTKVEISESGVVCVSLGVFYDLCIEEESVFPSGVYAQVSVSRSIIRDCLSQLLQESPLIIAILAKGIPFSFDVEEVVADECLLERQLLVFAVRGVLFGSRFDVMASVVRPDNTLQEAHRVCCTLLPRIVEQCDQSLWASYDMISGHLTPLSSSEKVEDEGNGKSNLDHVVPLFDDNSVLKRHLIDAPKGMFLAHWMVCECVAHDVDIQDELEALACEESKRSFEEFETAGN